jgi:hypothetical protein
MCKVDGCEILKNKAYGYCRLHWERIKRTGTTEVIDHKHSVEDRFWRFVTKLSNTECWMWTGSKNPKGYGHLPTGNEQLSHRLSYLLFKGEIPIKTMILHSCDNPGCVNPNHLYLGDNKQNMIDMISRGRAMPRGKPPKLNIEQVKLIAKSKDTVSNLVDEYNVSRGTIEQIKSGLIYAHLDIEINKASKGYGLKTKGESNYRAKLTDENVLQIRSSTESNRITALKYGVSTSLISMVRTRKIWQHI